jgi:alpha-amylase/alpha-mannosidase (GH57 family)
MERYICIHGHFYQPPRENPWLETVEIQDSAYPYHDWNERITVECYEPNATSRIFDGQRRIARIVNNYADISFNFGPTLLWWLEKFAPDTYARILEADRASRERFGGHGSAMAQAYNHMIMPLANRRDKYTQVLWGIRDFEHRFGRKPEGMWLPETAVDLETLDIMAELGLKFTILAPSQAHQVRKHRGRTWHDVSGARVDPTMVYDVHTSAKRHIAVFFYDGPISRAIAFEQLLVRGENLAGRLLSAFSDQRDWPQMVHIATDGESYGHHHRHGEMALSYAVHHIQENNLARLTNYGEFLEKHPPTHEARIFERTAWSCAHGVERWNSDCGCKADVMRPWNQAWRRPLRAALDWLRDALAPRFEEQGRKLFKDPWAARNDYVRVILDRSPESLDRFVQAHAPRLLDPPERSVALKLLEMQRHAMFMYTSCGWFFDELSGIETVQVLAYAGRAVQLAEELFQHPFEAEFLDRLAEAKSNLPEHADGRRIYQKFVKPAMVDLVRVGAHFAVSSLFEEYQERDEIFCFETERRAFELHTAGRTRLALGQVEVTSRVTRESALLDFAAVHLGQHNLHGGVRRHAGDEAFGRLAAELRQTFTAADFAAVHLGQHNLHGGVRRHAGDEAFGRLAAELRQTFTAADFAQLTGLLERELDAVNYSLRSLFRYEQRKILEVLLDSGPAERAYRDLYEEHLPLMAFLANLQAPIPRGLRMAAEYVINFDLQRALESPFDRQAIERLLQRAEQLKVELDRPGLGHVLGRRIASASSELAQAHGAFDQLEQFAQLVELAKWLPFEVGLHKAQNVYYDLLQQVYPERRREADAGNDEARRWTERFESLAGPLAVRLDR